MTKGYLIKCTYFDDDNKEHTYYMTKGGYVTHLYMAYFPYDVYKTQGIALRRCRELAEENKLDVELDRRDGRHIYYEEKYEPKEVNVYA